MVVKCSEEFGHEYVHRYVHRRPDPAPHARDLTARYCFAHDPDLQSRRAAGRLAGGHGKSTAQRIACRMPATLKPVLDRLYTTLAALATGACDARTATAMATLATAIARLYDQAEMAPRLQALEDAAAHGAPTPWVARHLDQRP